MYVFCLICWIRFSYFICYNNISLCLKWFYDEFYQVHCCASGLWDFFLFQLLWQKVQSVPAAFHPPEGVPGPHEPEMMLMESLWRNHDKSTHREPECLNSAASHHINSGPVFNVWHWEDFRPPDSRSHLWRWAAGVQLCAVIQFWSFIQNDKEWWRRKCGVISWCYWPWLAKSNSTITSSCVPNKRSYSCWLCSCICGLLLIDI